MFEKLQNRKTLFIAILALLAGLVAATWWWHQSDSKKKA
jgi:hypothetical protein